MKSKIGYNDRGHWFNRMLDQFNVTGSLYLMKSVIKILTFILSISISSNIFADVLKQDLLKTHLRWNIKAAKEQIKVSKSLSTVTIQSLDPEFFEQFSADIAKNEKQLGYHTNFRFSKPSVPGAPYKLDITLKDRSIELFSFYKSDESKYVLDFWINKDIVDTKSAAVAARPAKVKVAKLNSTPKKKIKKKKKTAKLTVAKAFSPKNSSKFSIITPSKSMSDEKDGKYRDFRYGAAFVWDYAPIIPPIERDIRLKEKAPDYFYTIKDRKLLDDKKEAHMQLSINFYRKAQWGLMTRSINLYEKRYGIDNNKAFNEFMKAVSLIKNTIKEKLKPEFLSKLDEAGEIIPAQEYSRKGLKAAARNMLQTVISSTRDYELTKSVLRYLIQHGREENDHIQTLNFAKKLYVKASENFDDEMTTYSSRVILNSLAHLRQIEKIKEFLGNKAVMRILPKQVGMAYISYVNLIKDETNQILASYKTNKRSLAKPVHPAILYNTAEAYFRHAQYEKAIKLYDDFLGLYSHLPAAGHARLRIALSYDLLDRPTKKVLQLYKDSINKTTDLKVRYEAKLRYVGLRVNRNKKPTERDRETIAFINTSADEKRVLDKNLNKLLWLTRLRTMISRGKYEDALAYLATIPLDGLRVIDQRVFIADGAEIVLGVIQDAYLKEDYARAVKVWEVYKEKYENKVAKSSYLSFIVSDSFIKLGLNKSYLRSAKTLKTLKEERVRSFPIWVKAHKKITVKDYLVELDLNDYLKQGNFKELGQFLEKNKKNKNINYKFYKGLVSYHLKKYNDSVTNFESLLVTPNINNILTPKQSVQMLETYIESLYEVAKPKRFRMNIAAIVNDVRRNSAKAFGNFIERAEYLYLESLYSEQKVNFKLLERKASEFTAIYKKSDYQARVQYLNGVAKVNNNNIDDGKKILKSLIDNKDVPEYLKSLARSELSTLELKNRTL